jgi:hypothetical protein
MTSISDYLQGYVKGYWEGYDFAVDHGDVEVEGSAGSAIGGADAPTSAPGPDPSVLRSAPAGIEECRLPEGSHPSAASSLPAIRQPALPAGVKIEGELERIHAHRGIVLGLRVALAEMFKLDLPEAEQAIAGLLAKDWHSEVES